MSERKTVGIRPALPFVLLFTLFGLLSLRFFQIQVVQGASFLEKQERILSRSRALPAPRARILDRRGRVLACSRPALTVQADTWEIEKSLGTSSLRNAENLAAAVSPLIGREPGFLASRLRGKYRYPVLARGLDPSSALAMKTFLKRNDILGFYFLEESKRDYPLGKVGAQVLGFYGSRKVGKDTVTRGLYGIERQFETQLQGKPGRRDYTDHPDPNRGGFFEEIQQPAVAGQDVQLTLDAVLSSITFEELERAAEEFQPRWASVLLMDPMSGEILALENYPFFDPNQYSKYPVNSFLNRAVSLVFTPGSAFKPFIMAAALQEGLVDLDEVFDCEMGAWRFRGRLIHDHKKQGLLTPAGILAQSSNIGMAKIGLRLGIPRAESYLRHFGFASRTGIGLPGESMGILTPLPRWSETYTLCSVSFGHEISTTLVRLAASFALFANGGRLVKPRVVRGWEDASGNRIRTRPERSEVKISSAVWRQVRHMLEGVMSSGTVGSVAGRTLRMAGKTGTTVKDHLDDRGRKLYTSVFLGFTLEKPHLLVAVAIDEPRGAYYGSKVAAPVGVRILERAARAAQAGGTEIRLAGPGQAGKGER